MGLRMVFKIRAHKIKYKHARGRMMISMSLVKYYYYMNQYIMINLNALNRTITCLHVKRLIYSFIPKQQLMWTTKKDYTQQHEWVETIMRDKSIYDTYMRMIIRNDMYFVFETILLSKSCKRGWKKKYKYGNTTFTDYYHFIDGYSFDNNAAKVRAILFSNVYRKKYKKIRRDIEWNT